MWHQKPAGLEAGLALIDTLSQSEHEVVRRNASNGFALFNEVTPEVQARVADIFNRLMHDPSESVRSCSATEIHNNIYKVDSLWDLTLKLIPEEASEAIKGDLYNALANSQRFDDCKSIFLDALGSDHSQPVAKGILNGVRYQDDNPHRDAIMAKLRESPYADVAEDAA